MGTETLGGYKKARSLRSERHSLMTGFTEAISSLNGRLGEPLRDLMALVPSGLNGAIFDAALDYSMASAAHSTAGTCPTGESLRRARLSVERKLDIEKNRVAR